MAGHGKVVWLTTKGRRTGRPRSVAVGFADEPDGSVLVAANDDSTAWARNLLAEPNCRVDIGRLTSFRSLAGSLVRGGLKQCTRDQHVLSEHRASM